MATARASGLDRPIRSLAKQSLRPVGVWVVAGCEAAQVALPDGWHRVSYAEPPYYAEEMALNAAADAVEADLIVLLADLTELDPWALQEMAETVVSFAPLVSGAYCAHDPATWAERFRLPTADPVCEPVAADSGFIYCMLTGIRREVWRQVNGLDERFAGANGYQDTNLARRVEVATGRKCWVNTSLLAHRAEYRGTDSLTIRKPKLWTPERNKTLDEALAPGIQRGDVRAWRNPTPMMPPPEFP